jgi:hypothetical protein
MTIQWIQDDGKKLQIGDETKVNCKKLTEITEMTDEAARY